MRLRRLRDDDDLNSDTQLVRGGELDPEVLRADAQRYHKVYGIYGISVFAVRGLPLDEIAQQVPLIRFQRLTVLLAHTLIACGLRLEPTGRNPRHYTIGFDDLDEGVKALVACGRQAMTNPYYDG